jgi:hypothetical protein
MCTKFREHFSSILSELCVAVLGSEPANAVRVEAAKQLRERYETVMTVLNKMSRLMRTTRDLTDQETRLLSQLGLQFGAAWHAAFPESYSPKVHMLAHHLVDVVKKYGSIGRLSEEGMEAKHALRNLALRSVWAVREPVKRQEALRLHEWVRTDATLWMRQQERRRQSERAVRLTKRQKRQEEDGPEPDEEKEEDVAEGLEMGAVGEDEE